MRYDLIHWMFSDTEDTLLQSYRSLARALELPLDRKASLEDLRERVHTFLGKERSHWLLIFDNAESRLPLPRGGSVLVTAQDATLFPGAQVIQLVPLTDKEAQQFLQEETGLNDEESLAALAHRCGGSPLALGYLAAALRQSGLSPAQYLEQMNQRVDTAAPAPSSWQSYGVWWLTRSRVSILRRLSCSISVPASIRKIYRCAGWSGLLHRSTALHPMKQRPKPTSWCSYSQAITLFAPTVTKKRSRCIACSTEFSGASCSNLT